MKAKRIILTTFLACTAFLTACGNESVEETKPQNEIVNENNNNNNIIQHEYKIKLYLNNGVINGQNYLDGDGYKYIVLKSGHGAFNIDNPTKEGLVFLGWRPKDSTITPRKDYSVASSFMADLELEAVFAKPVEVKFYDNASQKYFFESYYEGYNYTFNKLDDKYGYTFNGWLDSDNNLHKPGEQYTANGQTYYASWSFKTFNVTLTGDGVEEQSISIEYASNYTLPTPTMAGHQFDGWYYHDLKINTTNNWVYDTGYSGYEFDTNITLEAHWITDLAYELDDNNKTCVVSKYSGNDTKLEVPSTYNGYKVVGIKDYAFRYTSLEEIILPNTITEIGKFAFSDSSIKTINLPTSLKTIDESAFYYCGELTKLTIPQGVTFIGKNAFFGCHKLELEFESEDYWKLDKLSQTDYIDLSTFDFSTANSELCLYNLVKDKYSITYSSNLDEIDGLIRTYKPSEEYEIANPEITGYDFISWNVKYYNSNGELVELNDVTNFKIERGTYGDIELSANIQPKEYNVTVDSDGAECDVESFDIKFGENVSLPVLSKKGYDFDGFYINNQKVTNVWNIDVENPTIKAIFIPKEYTVNIYDSNQLKESLKLKYGEEYSLTKLTNGENEVGYYYDKDNNTYPLSGVWNTDSNVDLYPFWIQKGLVFTFNQELNGYEVSKSISLNTKELNIPEIYNGLPVIKIADNAFSNSSLEIVNIPGSMKYIGEKAFYMSLSLTDVNFLGDDIEIEARAFSECSNLVKINLPKNLNRISDYLFYNSSKLENVNIPTECEYIGKYAFNGTKITSITIPYKVKFIDINALNGISDVKFESITYWSLNNNTVNVNSIDFTDSMSVLGKTLSKDGYSISYGSIKDTNGKDLTLSLSKLPVYYNESKDIISNTIFEGYIVSKWNVKIKNISNSNIELEELDLSKLYGDLEIDIILEAKKYECEVTDGDTSSIINVTYNEEFNLDLVTKNGYNTVAYINNQKIESNIWVYDIENPIINIEYEPKEYTIVFRTNIDGVTLANTKVKFGESFNQQLGLEYDSFVLEYCKLDDKLINSNFKWNCYDKDTYIIDAIFVSSGLIYIFSENDDYVSVRGLDMYTGQKKIIIGEYYSGVPVIGLENNAFECCSSLEELILPKTLEFIGDYAMSSNRKLNIDLSGLTNLKSIGEKAFYFTKIEYIEIPASCTSIGADAFLLCNIEEMKFQSGTYWISNEDPTNYIDVEEYDFKDAYQRFNEGFTKLGYALTLKELNSSKTVFRDYKEEYVLEDGVEKGYTFDGWYLNGERIDRIPVGVYEDLVLESRWIPNEYYVTVNYGVSDIENKTIKVTYNESFTLPSVSREHYEIAGYTYNGSEFTTTAYNIASDITIDAVWKGEMISVTYITYTTGRTSTSVDTVTKQYEYGAKYTVYVPSNSYSFTSWYDSDNDRFFQSGDSFDYEKAFTVKTYLFSTGLTLTSRTTNGGITYYTIDGYSGSDKEVIIPAHVGPYDVLYINNNAFKNKTNIEYVNLPTTILGIGNNAFYGCTSLKQMIVNSNLSSFGEAVFEGCSSLERVELGKIVELPNNTFKDCSSLGYCYISGVKKIGDYAFYYCNSLYELRTDGEYIYEAGQYAFYHSNNFTLDLSRLTKMGEYAFGYTNFYNIIFKDNMYNNQIKYIPEGAFVGCSNVAKIVLPESVLYIGAYAFSDQTSLTSVTFPEYLREVGNSAFYNCTSLSTVVVNDNIEYVGNNVFKDCAKLSTNTYEKNNYIGNSTNKYIILVSTSVSKTSTSIKFHSNLRCICNNVFESMTKITSVDFTSTSLKSIGDFAFNNSPKLKTISFPSDVKHIGNYAFYDCAIENVTIPASIYTIGYSAFNKPLDDTLTSINVSSSYEYYSIFGYNDYSSIDELYGWRTVYYNSNYSHYFTKYGSSVALSYFRGNVIISTKYNDKLEEAIYDPYY